MAGSRLKADLWINEYLTPWDIYAHGIRRVLVHERTEYQDMAIVESGSFGRALVLDGKWQSSVADEFLYHEPLVHPACVVHGSPRRVLVLGGGEGATVREALRWKSVQRVVMVDLDGWVVEACREHLPEMHQGALDDPRVQIVIGDALEYIAKTEERWDVVISDLSDPIEHGPSFRLFTRETFEQIRGILSDGGVLTVQAGPVSPIEMDLHVRLVHTLGTVFAHAKSYQSYVPSYASPWGFCLAGERDLPERPDPEAVDAALASGTTGGLRMFDGRTMLGLFQIPLHLRRAIRAETKVYTLDDPPRFFGAGEQPPA